MNNHNLFYEIILFFSFLHLSTHLIFEVFGLQYRYQEMCALRLILENTVKQRLKLLSIGCTRSKYQLPVNRFFLLLNIEKYYDFFPIPPVDSHSSALSPQLFSRVSHYALPRVLMDVALSQRIKS